MYKLIIKVWHSFVTGRENALLSFHVSHGSGAKFLRNGKTYYT